MSLSKIPSGARRGRQARCYFRPLLAIVLLLAFCAGALGLAGCKRDMAEETKSEGVSVLQAWVHSGRQSERRIIADQVERFNAAHQTIRVELTFIPEGAYNGQVQAAALADELPHLLEFDGPFVYNYVWQGQLLPIKDLISAKTYANLLPSIVEQGTYQGQLWSAGMYDSGLGLYGSRRQLAIVDARIPDHPAEAWTVEEFDAILHRLAEHDEDGRVLDLKLNYRGEWFTYAFSPALASAGGDLVARPDYHTARDVLDGEESIAAMRWFQRWVKNAQLVDPNVDDNAFVSGRVALSWVGHWEYERYHAAHGDDLVLLPLPDFGRGARTGQGSWSWGITRNCPDPEAAGTFIDFLLQDRQVLEMAHGNGAVPGTRSAIEQSERYGRQGVLRLYAVQLTDGFGVPRPQTPAYPVITTIFQKAFQDIVNGAEIERALGKAAMEITRDIHDNKGYPLVVHDGHEEGGG